MFILDKFMESLMVLISTPVYIILIGLEILLSNYRKRKSYTLADTVENVYLMLMNMGIDFILRGFYLAFFMFLYQFRWIDWESVWVYWIALFFAEDLMYWVLHYMDHHCRLLWAVHVTHHSSEHYNLTVGFRSSVFQPLYRFIFFIPLSFLGFKGLDILFIYSATQIYGILIHTRYIGKLGILDYILATPSNHRVHHGSNVLYLDRNMGMVFIFWDRLFGTYTPETEEVHYGLRENIKSHNPANVVFHEWKSIWKDVKNAPAASDRLMYIFGPPGWSHDGRKKTSKQLRELYGQENSQVLELEKETFVSPG